jgi:predicted KAP-like P-loop ATPase
METKNSRFNFNPDVFCVEDKLGFTQYVKTLGGMITSEDFKTPFCIGVYGDWGSGKTSFMRQLAKRICEPEKKDAKENKKTRVVPVWFNPWRYAKEEHLIIPFLKTIAQETENYLAELEKKGEKENNSGLVESVNGFITGTRRLVDAVIYATKFTIKPSFLGFSIGEVEFDTAKGQERDEKLGQKRIEADKKLAEELSSIYYDAIRHLEGTIKGKGFRIAVFIDDLDRCLPEKAIQLLEAVKLFLDLEGYVFVIGVDKEVVERGIAWHYRHLDHSAEQQVGEKEKKEKHAAILSICKKSPQEKQRKRRLKRWGASRRHSWRY